MKFVLAPLAGFTDAPFRRLCAEGGADLAYTEMVSAAGLAHGSSPTRHLMETMPGEGPVACQLFGARESDLAFKARIKGGPEIFVGILLEHKSYRKRDVLSQIYRYTFEVMQNKGATDFGWLPTKAIIIYNGQNGWDPMAEFRAKHKGSFNGRELPFECVLVNLANVPDMACFRESNVEAAIGTLVMKHAFDADGLNGIVERLVKMLSKLENDARATLADKIVVYLHEYLDKDVVEELRMRMSIGQALGIKTAGDRLRAAERAALRRGVKKGAQQEREKNEADNAARDSKRADYLRSQNVPDSVISAMLALK